MKTAIEDPTTDVVIVGVPNNLHKEAVLLAARAGKPVLCTKPLGRTAAEALEMLEAVEKAGVFAGYLEDLVYTPKTLKALDAGPGRGPGPHSLGPLARNPSRPAQRLVLGQGASPAAEPSSTWAATASRSSAASSARGCVRSRSWPRPTRSSIRSTPRIPAWR